MDFKNRPASLAALLSSPGQYEKLVLRWSYLTGYNSLTQVATRGPDPLSKAVGDMLLHYLILYDGNFEYPRTSSFIQGCERCARNTSRLAF